MILGLTGRAGVGKDTVADILVRDYAFTKLSFAAVLKDMLKAGGMAEPSRELKEELIPGVNFTWRQAAQTLGTEWGRSLDPDIWVKLTMAKIGASGDYVISDCRFPNEALALRDKGWVVHITGRNTTLTGAAAIHVSELPVPWVEGDRILMNDSDKDRLRDRVNDMMLEIVSEYR